jgi:hypothetical protein
MIDFCRVNQIVRCCANVSGKLDCQALLTPLASESHFGVSLRHHERGWTRSVDARGERATSQRRESADPWAAMDVFQRPQRCAKLSEVVIFNKMQDLSGLNGLEFRLVVPP